jgi:hypothetical protein
VKFRRALKRYYEPLPRRKCRGPALDLPIRQTYMTNNLETRQDSLHPRLHSLWFPPGYVSALRDLVSTFPSTMRYLSPRTNSSLGQTPSFKQHLTSQGVASYSKLSLRPPQLDILRSFAYDAQTAKRCNALTCMTPMPSSILVSRKACLQSAT